MIMVHAAPLYRVSLPLSEETVDEVFESVTLPVCSGGLAHVSKLVALEWGCDVR
jgi:hypothetical protein